MTEQSATRIGVLTSGGDAPGLNAVIRAVVKTATVQYGWEVLGFEDGYEGLLKDDAYRILGGRDVQGLLPMGGTILGTTNRGHFGPATVEALRTPGDPFDIGMQNFRRMGLRGLISIGGEGSARIAMEFSKQGLPVVCVPKTIDNDLPGTDQTFGFDTALQVATEALDRLHTTAASHDRVMVLEVMGRHAGWIALQAGIAGGADVILIPEIKYRMEAIAAKIRERESRGNSFSIIVVAEGAAQIGGEPVYIARGRLGGISYQIGAQIEELTGKECRVVVLGHVQRGGQPSPRDRLLATRFGAAAVRFLAEGCTGVLAGLRCAQIMPVPLTEVCVGIKAVPVDGELVTTARGMGISFGDELV